jgi:hypothetical protein
MPTRRDMTILAEICQTLAKFPDTYAHGPESLTSKKDMFDALDYMHYANNLGEPIDNIIVSNRFISTILFLL